MDKRESDLAKAADLIAPATGETEVFLKTLKKKVVIRKVNIGDIASIMKVAKENEIDQFILLCFKGLKKPALTLEQAKKLPLKVIVELSAEIAKFSELDKGSIDKIQNLLTTES